MKKSLSDTGNINTIGLFSTIIAILPFNKFIQVKSGLSVHSIWGNILCISFTEY